MSGPLRLYKRHMLVDNVAVCLNIVELLLNLLLWSLSLSIQLVCNQGNYSVVNVIFVYSKTIFSVHAVKQNNCFKPHFASCV